ncbi:MAG TPA: flagellar protein export ATPase FliI [Myxococcota bacterium]|nr:flagellar protein export ATPase FliI [Myxococcota bacterium]
MTPFESPEARAHRWSDFLATCASAAGAVAPFRVTGHLTRVAGLVMEAAGLQLPIGSGCTVRLANGHRVGAEVAGFAGERLFLMPTEDAYGLAPGASVFATEQLPRPPRMHAPVVPRRRSTDLGRHVPVGDALLGRVLDGAGHPLDDLGPLNAQDMAPLYSRPVNPLERSPIDTVLDVGVRAINGLLTVGRGQRMGLFSGSGVGKSVLLGMMARYTSADVTVVGLIGERGREVQEFIEQILGPDGLARSVVIAAPADTSPLLRIHGAAYAAAVAEYFRDQGRHVLLIMDSLTRFAMAHREISLAIGEPPATKGYPPSVFARLPKLVERAGNGRRGSGSITAFYTVLTEGDDQDDPVADSARAILDGHVVLARSLADAGHYPAIDIEASVSRVLPALAEAPQMEALRQFKAQLARYQRNRDLISVGAYVAGSDPALDRAIQMYPRFEGYLRQNMRERAAHAESVAALHALFAEAPAQASVA